MDEIESAVGVGELVRETTKDNITILVNNTMTESKTKKVQKDTSKSSCG